MASELVSGLLLWPDAGRGKGEGAETEEGLREEGARTVGAIVAPSKLSPASSSVTSLSMVASSARAAAPDPLIALPHAGQNRAPRAACAPHEVQNMEPEF
jgi:hypothetical protein